MSRGDFIRLLIDKPADGAWNMAVDEAILRMASLGRSQTTVRIYMWKRPTISAGYFSRVSDELLRRCERRRIDVVRRISGGGIILHSDEVTYSVVLPRNSIWTCSTIETYRHIAEGVVTGLHRLGVEARLAWHAELANAQNESCMSKHHGGARVSDKFCYTLRSQSDILVGSLKLVGSAQARCKGAILQHGSLPLSWDSELVGEIFDGDEISSCGFTSLSDILHRKPKVEEVIEALRYGFEYAFAARMRIGKLSEDEIELAIKLSNRRRILKCAN